jgi:hypothetical protein
VAAVDLHQLAGLLVVPQVAPMCLISSKAVGAVALEALAKQELTQRLLVVEAALAQNGIILLPMEPVVVVDILQVV